MKKSWVSTLRNDPSMVDVPSANRKQHPMPVLDAPQVAKKTATAGLMNP